MKKLFIVFLATVMMIATCAGLVGCDQGSSVPETEEPPKEEIPADIGSFKSLEDAYKAGWITHDDLKNIAYYYNGQNDSHFYEVMQFQDENGEVIEYVPCPEAEFIPKPESFEKFTHENLTKMKYCYKKYISSQVGFDKIGCAGYYGEYGDCVAVVMYEEVITDGMCGDPPETFIRLAYRLEDLTFYGNSAKEIIIWNSKVFE